MIIFPQNFDGAKRNQHSLSKAFKLGHKFLEDVYKINKYIIEVIFDIATLTSMLTFIPNQRFNSKPRQQVQHNFDVNVDHRS